MYLWNLALVCTAVEGGGGEVCWKKVELECPLDEETEWVVGCSTETVDSSPSTESMDSWTVVPWTESVESSPSTESMDSWTVVPWTESVDFYLSIGLQRMSLYPSLGLHTVPT